MRRDERGQNLVELALVLPLLVLLLAGMVDFGRAFHDYIVIANAAREGARWGSRYPADSVGIANAAIAAAANDGVTLSGSMITPFLAGGAWAGQPIRVSISYSFNPMFASILGIGTIDIATQAEMIIYGIDPT